MLRKERELEEARKKLAQIRQQQYKFLPSELREDEGWLAEQTLDVRRADETLMSQGAAASVQLAALFSNIQHLKQACLVMKTSACTL